VKIDPTIKHQDLSQDFMEQLGFIPTSDVKSTVVVLIILMYDIPLAAGLLSIFKIEVLWVVAPLIIIIHLWGLRLLIKNPYSTQFEMVLLLGVYGVIGAISLFIVVQGMSFYVLNITSIYYYIVINFVTIFISSILVKYQIDKYSRDPLKEQESGNQSKYIGLLALAPAIGYMLGQSAQDTFILKHFIALVVFYFFTLLNVYVAAKFIHRYYFMKANMDYVVFQKPSKRERKELDKKGVMIK